MAGRAVSRESWRPIPSVPGYQASSRGRIRNAATGRVLTPKPTTNGYLQLHCGRANPNRLVHRLVCEAWHGLPALPTHHADHIDFNRLNNRPSNLRWLPAGLNIGRQVRWGRRGWEIEEPPEWAETYEPMSAAESAALDADLAMAGW